MGGGAVGTRLGDDQSIEERRLVISEVNKKNEDLYNINKQITLLKRDKVFKWDISKMHPLSPYPLPPKI